MSDLPELKQYWSVWATFLMYKYWGINEDCLSSTHPICAGYIADTGDAESLFDGISYGKGSSFLKLMYKVVGYETMKKGLHKYFADHSWKNTTLKDFVGCIAWAYEQDGDQSMGEGFNFTEWCDTWLTTSGINIL